MRNGKSQPATAASLKPEAKSRGQARGVAVTRRGRRQKEKEDDYTRGVKEDKGLLCECRQVSKESRRSVVDVGGKRKRRASSRNRERQSQFDVFTRRGGAAGRQN